MFWLKKAVTFCLMPLPASLALMVVGTVLGYFRPRSRCGRQIALAGLVLLLIASNRQVGLWLLSPLEQQYPAIPELSVSAPLPADLAACRYIVVLGGGHANTTGLPATSKLSVYTLGRITEAVRLARLLPSAKIITTGPGEPGEPTHAEILATAGISLGVGPARFACLSTGRDTENEAIALHQRLGDTPFALVTSAWHMPRAMGLMRHAGLRPVACPADYHARVQDRFDISSWLWGIDGLERTSWALYERLGMLWARMRGRIDS